MTLRQEFLEHKKKTVDSFSLVSTDISNIHINLSNLKSVIESMESKVDKCMSDINAQRTAELAVNSSIKGIRNTVSEINSKISSAGADTTKKLNSFDAKLKTSAANSRRISKKVTFSSNAVKKLLPRSKTQSLKVRRIGSMLREYEDSIQKVKNLVNRRIKTLKRINLELEQKVASQRKRITQLNRKIEGKKVSRRTVRRASRKTIIRKITPKKTITTIKTPKRKEVYEVIREKKPLI